MPKLPQYDAGQEAFRPTDLGVEATAAAARRVGMFYNQQATSEERLAAETERLGAQTEQLGRFKGEMLDQAGRNIGSGIAAAGDAAVKWNDQRQISQGAAAYTGMLSNMTQQWNETVKNADPNDPTVAQRFMASIEPQLESFKSAMLTEGAQQWAEGHIDALRQHFVEKTSGDMSTLAGQAAVVNMQSSINSLSNTVHGDPSSVSFALAALRSSTEGILANSPTLSAVDAGKARTEIMQKGAEEIVKSAAIGYISKTGQVPGWVSDPKFSPYVNGQELQLFARQARSQQRVDALTAKQTQLAQRQLDELNVHAAMNQNFSNNVTFDQASGKVNINPQFFENVLDTVRKYPNAPNASTTARAYIDWGESQQRERAQPVVSDPTVRNNLMNGLFSPDNPTTRVDILKAEAQEKLSAHDGETLRQLATELEQTPLKGAMWTDTMKAVHSALTYSMPGMPGKDPKGEQAYASFVQQFVPNYLRQYRAGTLPPDALNMNDPNSLISKSMAQFKRSPAQMMQDRITELGDIAPVNGATPTPAAPPPSPTKPTPGGTIYLTTDRVGRTPGPLVRQNGHTYQRQPDGSYKAVD